MPRAVFEADLKHRGVEMNDYTNEPLNKMLEKVGRVIFSQIIDKEEVFELLYTTIVGYEKDTNLLLGKIQEVPRHLNLKGIVRFPRKDLVFVID